MKQELPKAVYIDGSWYRVSGPGSLTAWLFWQLGKITLLLTGISLCRMVGTWVGELAFRWFGD